MKAKILKPSWAAAVQLELFADDLGPRPPSANILTFQKRSTVVSVRMPEELALEIRRRAQGFQWTPSHYCLRVLSEKCDGGQWLQGLHGLQGKRRSAVA